MVHTSDISVVKRKLKISQLARDIRKKYVALKLGKSEEDEVLEKIFKPISSPLKAALDTTATRKSDPIKREIKKEESSFQTDPDITFTDAAAAADDGNVTTTESGNESDYQDTFSHDPNEEATIATAIAAPNIHKYTEVLQEYVSNFGGKSSKIDVVYGPKYDSVTDRWYLGIKILEFNAKGEVIVDGQKFRGTKGLYNLIFYKDPEPYSSRDLASYKSILDISFAHRDTRNRLKQSGMRKYTEIIRPLYKSSSTSGEGLKMMYNNKNTEYVYWDDINELVDRLKLLIASKDAGNTSHDNEIVAIINELKEAGVIV